MIHKTAIIAKTVQLGKDVEIGPYTVIEGDVSIGNGCRIGPRAHILGWTSIGRNTTVHANAIIGDAPQDYSYNGERSFCHIGDNNIIREYTTIHRGAEKDSVTTIGSNCMLMAFSHVGHNAKVSDHCTVGNHTVIAGHVELESNTNLSGYIGIHQFCRVGSWSMVGGYIKPTKDIPPYCLVADGCLVYGPNNVGLKRADIPLDSRKAIKHAIRTFYFSGKLKAEALEEIEAAYSDISEVQHFVDFIQTSKRGVLPSRPR
ncbi:acyl-[acyl-carrier-protein]--UDP-N-acetylglucosamine O-acyltransferase [bacterium M21]|nr:acyl-[acyl-carrier-protein]--UDP-N-acetylglucosamine O-acyltransferase [bacterium M21]